MGSISGKVCPNRSGRPFVFQSLPCQGESKSSFGVGRLMEFSDAF